MDGVLEHILGIAVLIPATFIALTIHEFGHYFCARAFGVHAIEYSLGYGRRIWRKSNADKTSYVIRSIPIAAHVSFDEKKFESLSPFKRSAIILAGPLSNLFLAFLLFLVFFCVFGQPSTPPVITGVEISAAADKTGIKPGDKIVELNGKAMSRYEEVLAVTYPLPIKSLDLLIERDGKTLEITITPDEISYVDTRGMIKKHGRLGVTARHTPYKLESLAAINDIQIPQDDNRYARDMLLKHMDQDVLIALRSTDGKDHVYQTSLSASLNQHLVSEYEDKEYFILGDIGNNFYKKLNSFESFTQAGKQTGELLKTVAGVPFQLFPLDRDKLSPQSLLHGEEKKSVNYLYRFFYITALISIAIGLINLIPFIYFDGGKLLIIAFENMTPLEMNAKQKIFVTFLALFIFYIAVVVSNFSKFPAYASKKYCSFDFTNCD